MERRVVLQCTCPGMTQTQTQTEKKPWRPLEGGPLQLKSHRKSEKATSVPSVQLKINFVEWIGEG